MHYIQKHILDVLRTAESVRYTQLNRDEIESGHFRYHLTQLVTDGYVEQIERGVYKLTSKGQQIVDRMSEHRVVPENMPKVITYTLLCNDDFLYLIKKPKQPYMNLLNMIGGKLHEGETAQSAAQREVNEKLDVDLEPPQLRGVFEVILRQGKAVFTHAIAYVFSAEVDETTLPIEKLVAVPKTKVASTEKLAPDFVPIYEQLRDAVVIGSLDITI